MSNKRYMEMMLKNSKYFKKNFKIIEFNIIFYLNYNEKEKILVKKIRKCWNVTIKKFKNLYKIIFNYVVLIFTFINNVKIKKNLYIEKDNRVVQKKIWEIFQFFKNNRWRPKIFKRIFIAKKLKNIKSLPVLTFYDEIILITIKIILNFIFEKIKGLNIFLKNIRYFHNANHAYRLFKNFHSALNCVLTWKILPWVIQSKIINSNEKIKKKKLVSIIKKSIEDSLIIRIIFYKS